MDADWIKLPNARRIVAHWADPRPAWLWSADGGTLLWRNMAARYFYSKVKKSGIKLSPEAQPIRGQVPRVLRMGTLGRPSLSRLQFLVGEKPVSATCTCTPLQMQDGQTALLVVGVDPVDAQLFNEPLALDALSESLLPPGAAHLLLDADNQITGGSAEALATYAPAIEADGMPELGETGSAVVTLQGRTMMVTRLTASPTGASLLLIEAPPHRDALDDAVPPAEAVAIEAATIAEPDVAVELEPTPEPESAPTPVSEVARTPDADVTQWSEDRSDDVVSGPNFVVQPEIGFLPDEEQQLEEDLLSAGIDSESWHEPEDIGPEIAPEAGDQVSDEAARSLTGLFDRLAGDERLFTPLNTADDQIPPGAYTPAQPEPEPEPVVPETEPDDGKPALYKIIGSGFLARADDAGVTLVPEASDETSAEPFELSFDDTPFEDMPPVEEPEQPSAAASILTPPRDSEVVERVSRYNFDELARILNDRVGGDRVGGDYAGSAQRNVASPPPPEVAAPDNALVTLGGETFVLNRLSLGILVFRDQQVLFANRALTDLTGHESVESLRAAGLETMFPSVEAVAGGAGPLHHLIRRDGVLVPVNARLQAISWQGRPALMLSASLSETATGHEAAVRAFAEILADASEDGFVGTDRAGFITSLSGHAAVLLGHPAVDFVGRALSVMIAPQDTAALRSFLERPARFAETARPGISLAGTGGTTEILLFAEGQAGIVAGYFGFVRRRQTVLPVQEPAEPVLVPAAEPREQVEPGLLTRVSRGIRRPLNSILGFSELIVGNDTTQVEPARVREYAGDIVGAGQEIAVLVDELDDYARLKEGRYVATSADTDLGALLDAVVGRVRGQANDQRVLVRSSVSERLPRIRADQPSLTQAMLNLFASAIDQTPAGGSAVLSAKWADDGGIDVHMRSSAELNANMPDQFVVFRDGIGKNGETLTPVRSSVGLALTRALLAVNSCTLSVDPTAGAGTLFSLLIPGDLVIPA